MWFVGHSAIAYLFALPFLVATDNKRVLRTVAVVPFFGNLIDFLHFESLRHYIHNLVGGLVIPFVAILIWRVTMHWSWYELMVLLIASTAAMVGDLVSGPFYPYAPLDWQPVGLWAFGGPEDLLFEAVVGLGVIFAFLSQFRSLSGPRAISYKRDRGLIPLPLLTVLATSGLFWGEVYMFVDWYANGLLAQPVVMIVLLEMVAVSLLMTALWMAAVLASKVR